VTVTDARAPLSWERQGLLLVPPEGHAHWATHAQAPTVLVVDDHCWRVYFSARDAANRGHLHYADVDPNDGFRLLHLEDRPLLELGSPGSFDAHGIGPSAALRVGSQVWLYYSGISARQDVPYEIAVGLAISDDGGRSFRRACAGPVMARGPYDPFFVSTPFVWQDGHAFRALYSSATRWLREDQRWECCYDLRYAESADGLHWTAHPHPALSLTEDEAGLVRPWVVPMRGGYRMWFSRRGGDRFRDRDGQGYRIQSAVSTDGRHWQRDPADIAWSPPPEAADWDAWMQAYPCVVPLGSDWVMLYNGNDFGRGGFGWARAARPAPELP
jgi:hypothetical protein